MLPLLTQPPAPSSFPQLQGSRSSPVTGAHPPQKARLLPSFPSSWLLLQTAGQLGTWLLPAQTPAPARLLLPGGSAPRTRRAPGWSHAGCHIQRSRHHRCPLPGLLCSPTQPRSLRLSFRIGSDCFQAISLICQHHFRFQPCFLQPSRLPPPPSKHGTPGPRRSPTRAWGCRASEGDPNSPTCLLTCMVAALQRPPSLPLSPRARVPCSAAGGGLRCRTARREMLPSGSEGCSQLVLSSLPCLLPRKSSP